MQPVLCDRVSASRASREGQKDRLGRQDSLAWGEVSVEGAGVRWRSRGRLPQYVSTRSASAARRTKTLGIPNSAGLPAMSSLVMPRALADIPER